MKHLPLILLSLSLVTFFGCRDQSPEKGQVGSLEAPIAANTAVALGDWSYTLKSVKQVPMVTDGYATCKASPGKKLVVVDYEVQNVSPEHRAEVRFDWALYLKGKRVNSAWEPPKPGTGHLVKDAHAKKDDHGAEDAKKDGHGDGHGDGHHGEPFNPVDGPFSAGTYKLFPQPDGPYVYAHVKTCQGLFDRNVEFAVNPEEKKALKAIFEVDAKAQLDLLRHTGPVGTIWFKTL